MGNPSTVWADLALPNPPVGSIPFVYTDGASIVTDVIDFFFQSLTAPVPVVSNVALLGILPAQLTILNGIRKAYSDTTGVPGAAVINKTAGRVKFAAGQTTLVVTCNCCTATSIISAQLEGAFDATAKKINVTPGVGTFTLTLDAACTAAVTATFNITSVY